jgi:hypothetical protein
MDRTATPTRGVQLVAICHIDKLDRLLERLLNHYRRVSIVRNTWCSAVHDSRKLDNDFSSRCSGERWGVAEDSQKLPRPRGITTTTVASTHLHDTTRAEEDVRDVEAINSRILTDANGTTEMRRTIIRGPEQNETGEEQLRPWPDALTGSCML